MYFKGLESGEQLNSTISRQTPSNSNPFSDISDNFTRLLDFISYDLLFNYGRAMSSVACLCNSYIRGNTSTTLQTAVRGCSISRMYRLGVTGMLPNDVNCLEDPSFNLTDMKQCVLMTVLVLVMMLHVTY